MRLPKEWTPHTVSVRPFLGVGGNGPIIGESQTIENVYVKDISEIVTDDDGQEAVSRATVRFSLEDLPAKGSLITVWPGTPHAYEASLFKVSRLDHPAWPSLGVGWLR